MKNYTSLPYYRKLMNLTDKMLDCDAMYNFSDRERGFYPCEIMQGYLWDKGKYAGSLKRKGIKQQINYAVKNNILTAKQIYTLFVEEASICVWEGRLELPEAKQLINSQ